VSDLREIVKIINQIAIDNSESNSKEGEVVKLNDDGSHNIKLTEENGVEYTIQNRWSDDGKSKYPEGTRVIMTLPDGSLDRSVIRGNANFTLPSSPTVKHFSTAPISTAPNGENIYLCYPDDGLIKVYSLAGAAGTDISPESGVFENICTDGTYLYYGSSAAYAVYKIKPDGSELQNIVMQSRYYNSYGLAIDPTVTYLYQIDGNENCIARITIAEEYVDTTWKDFNSGFDYTLEPTDLCGNENYLFVTGNVYSSGGQSVTRVFDYSGNFVREVSFSSTDTYKITADDTNIYLYSSSSVEIYTISGTFVRSISVANIQAVTVKDGYIYIVTTSKIKKYNSSGVFQSEFEIEGTVEDAVIT